MDEVVLSLFKQLSFCGTSCNNNTNSWLLWVKKITVSVDQWRFRVTIILTVMATKSNYNSILSILRPRWLQDSLGFIPRVWESYVSGRENVFLICWNVPEQNVKNHLQLISHVYMDHSGASSTSVGDSTIWLIIGQVSNTSCWICRKLA